MSYSILNFEVEESANNEVSVGPLICYGYLMGNYPPDWLRLPLVQSYDAKSWPQVYNEE